MKVRLYTESFKPYLSGVTVSVETFADGLADLGHEVLVLAPGYPDYQDNFSYKVFRFPSLGTRLYPGFRLSLPFSWKHKKLEKPDIIHSHSPYQLGYLAQRYAKQNKIPFVYHFHTLFTEYLHFVPLPRFISVPVVKAIVRSFCRNCDLIITPTAIVKNILQKEYGITQRIEVLPTGVDEKAVASADPQGIREKYGVKQQEILLQYCGRLSKEKNIEFLLRMFKLLLADYAQVKLMIVAFGPLEQELKKIAIDLKISEQVIFTGRIEREKIYNYLKAADLFVCASKTETQGLVISEAKACGKPAVGINAQGVGQMIENGVDGFLVPDDLTAFKQTVLKLIKDPELLKKFSEQAESNARQKYFNSAITKKLESLYNSLRGGRV